VDIGRDEERHGNGHLIPGYAEYSDYFWRGSCHVEGNCVS